MAKADVISVEDARRMFHYDPETGVMTRKISTSCTTKPGQVVGSDDLYGYKTVRVGSRRDGTAKSYKVHRLAWLIVHGVWPEGDIDHINGQRSDNRLCNLRDVSRRLNLQNKSDPVRSRSGVRGVHIDKHGRRFVAAINDRSKKIHLGTFDTIEEAEAAYRSAKARMHEAWNDNAPR